MKSQTSGKILGRAWVYDTGDPSHIELWSHELEPMEGNKQPDYEWARSHFAECLSDDDLRKMFNLPETGNYQVLFSGEMSGGPCGGFEYPDEWDEQFDLDDDFKVAPIPIEYMEFTK